MFNIFRRSAAPAVRNPQSHVADEVPRVRYTPHMEDEYNGFVDPQQPYGMHNVQQPPPDFYNHQHFSQQPPPTPASSIQPATGNYPNFRSYDSYPPQQMLPQAPVYHDLTNAGPQQSRKSDGSAESETGNVNVHLPRFNPRALLDPKNARQTPNGASPPAGSSGTMTPAEGGDEVEAPSMSSMMQDQWRTTERQHAAHRKRKSDVLADEEEEDPNKKAKMTFNGIARGGVLHDHMQDEREKIAAKRGPIRTDIDLTGDDNASKNSKDDELQIVKEQRNANDEICLGGFSGKANMSRLPTYGQTALGTFKDMYPKLRLNYYRDATNPNQFKIILRDRRNHRDLGYVDLRIARPLCQLLDGGNLSKVQATFWLEVHPTIKSEKPGDHISRAMNIIVVLHAPRGKAEQIGNFLARNSLWLSSPAQLGLHVGKEVVNPHLPKNYGPRGVQGERRPQTSGSAAVAVVRTAEEIRREADSMFDNLMKHEDLPRLDADSTIIKTPLLDHQKQGLYFLTDHERSDRYADTEGSTTSLWKYAPDQRGRDKWRHVITGHEVIEKPKPLLGGILADMMGLGKTLSILSLIAHTKTRSKAFSEEEPPQDLGVQRNARGTLIVCPKSVMSNWSEQIRAHVVRNKLSCYVYHGSNRLQEVDELAQYDIVLTTYNTAASDFNNKGRAVSMINWFRIVLDEAHQIRNQNTAVSKACIDLVAERRWAVTGTPVQNGLGDFGALIKFLHVHPFSDSHTWSQHIIVPLKSGNTDASTHLSLLVGSLTLRRLKDKIGLKGKKDTNEYLTFGDEEKKQYENLAGTSRKEVMLLSGGGRMRGKAYAHILKAMGRMRQFCAHNLDMFSEDDRKEVLEGMDPDNAIAIDLGDEPGREGYEFVTEKHAYDTLHLVNEANADNCERCGRKIGDADGNVDPVSEDDDETTDSDDETDDVLGYLNPCFHLICPGCKDGYVQEAQAEITIDERHHCPLCTSFIHFGLFEYHRKAFRDFVEAKSAAVKKRKVRGKYNSEDYNGPSTKVRALLEDLSVSAEETSKLPEGEPPVRTVVFSGWTTYLDLIEIALADHGYGYLRLDGKMSVGQRTKVLEQFKTDPDKVVLLVSIKAGGQGLNFTAANKVYMMEPQYNPGVEQQAIDRVHRLGQKRDVVIKRYIIRDSIEEGILKLQARKEDLANLTLERKKEMRADVTKKRLEDLKDLFR